MLEPSATNQHHYVFSDADVWMFPPDKPYLSYICYSDWTDGHHHMMHAHQDVAEILLILKGHGQYLIGENKYSVSAGTVILCNPGVLHDEFPQTDEPYQTLCAGIKSIPTASEKPYHLIDTAICPVFQKPDIYDDLVQLFLQIERFAVEKKPYYQTICEYLLLAALSLIQRLIAGHPNQSEQPQETLSIQVERYIDAHFAENLSVEQLSHRFFINPYHLSHLFKKERGCSLKHYILRRRIGEAQTRLCSTKAPIQQIAAEVGFADANYFSRVFTKYVGMSPTEYRDFRTEKS